MTVAPDLQQLAAPGPDQPRPGGGRLATTRQVLKRAAALLITLLISSLVVVASLSLAPGSPITYLAGGQEVTPELAAQLTAQYHLDQAWPVRWVAWLGAAVQGDFGTSLFFQDTVWNVVTSRLGGTLFLVVYASVLTVALGVGVGLVAGLRGGVIGSLLSSATTTAIAVPAFVAAVFLLTIFAVWLPWFPALGSGTGFIDQLYHLTLPAIALALGASAVIARVTRSSVRTELHREHVETATLRGLPRRTIIRRHVLRNALTPIVTVCGLTVAGMFAGTVVVETAFGLDGVGSLLVQAIQQKDFAVVQFIVLLLVTIFLIVNSLVDLSYGFIDPRVRDAGPNR